jgi:hypothetical protein
MDDAAFAIWRADIVLLTATQRSLAFFELASAEANNPIDPFDQEEDAKTARPNAISGASDAVAPSGASSAVAPAAESDLLSQVGRKSNREFRLPSLSRGFDWLSGARRMACLGTAARNAARHSVRSRGRRWPDCTTRNDGWIRRKL